MMAAVTMKADTSPARRGSRAGAPLWNTGSPAGVSGTYTIYTHTHIQYNIHWVYKTLGTPALFMTD